MTLFRAAEQVELQEERGGPLRKSAGRGRAADRALRRGRGEAASEAA
jgi:hypothetical protein